MARLRYWTVSPLAFGGAFGLIGSTVDHLVYHPELTNAQALRSNGYVILFCLLSLAAAAVIAKYTERN